MMKCANKMIAIGVNFILCLKFFSPYCMGSHDYQMQSGGTRLNVTMTITIADQYMSLSCVLPKRRYQVNDTMDIQFSVTNTSHEVVYLIVPEPKDISSVMRMEGKNDSMYNKDMYIEVKKFQVYEEYFEMPRLVRLAPGERHVGEVKPKLVYYTPGAKFSVYLTVYYMKEEKLVEFERQLNALGPKAGADFPASVIKLTSSPIKLSIAP